MFRVISENYGILRFQIITVYSVIFRYILGIQFFANISAPEASRAILTLNTVTV